MAKLVDAPDLKSDDRNGSYGFDSRSGYHTMTEMKRIIFAKRIPDICYLAFSGGVDSTVLLDLLLKKRTVRVSLVLSTNSSDWSGVELDFARKVSAEKEIPLLTHHISTEPNKTSLESHWSRERKSFFESLSNPVLTAHHLDDAVEWYVLSTMRGRSEVMPLVSGNVQRPLLLTSKEHIRQHAKNYNLSWLEDPYTDGTANGLRLKMRERLMPELFNVFPGAHKVVSKLILSQKKESDY